jgi:hypothetical protein
MQPRFKKCLNLCCDCGLAGTPYEGDTDELLFVGGYRSGGGAPTGVVAWQGAIPASTPTYTVASSAGETTVKIERSGQYRASFVSYNISGLIVKLGISVDSADLTTAFDLTTAGMREYVDGLAFEAGNPDRICLTAVFFITEAMAADPGLGVLRWQAAAGDTMAGHGRVTRVGNFG